MIKGRILIGNRTPTPKALKRMAFPGPWWLHEPSCPMKFRVSYRFPFVQYLKLKHTAVAGWLWGWVCNWIACVTSDKPLTFL